MTSTPFVGPGSGSLGGLAAALAAAQQAAAANQAEAAAAAQQAAQAQQAASVAAIQPPRTGSAGLAAGNGDGLGLPTGALIGGLGVAIGVFGIIRKRSIDRSR
jgi:hypothetical protein